MDLIPVAYKLENLSRNEFTQRLNALLSQSRYIFPEDDNGVSLMFLLKFMLISCCRMLSVTWRIGMLSLP